MKRLPKSEGQALLIILLIMAVALTIGLSVISRSITDIKISQQTEEAARAFSAAEAGIEEALVTGQSNLNPIPFETGATYQTEVAGLGEGQTEYAFPGEFGTDEIQTLWLADYKTLGGVYAGDQLRIVWGKSGSSESPAIEVSIYYKDGTNYKVGRFALDSTTRTPDDKFCRPDGTNCPASVTSFTTAGESVGEKTFKFGATLDISDFNNPQTLLFARLRLFYSSDKHSLGAKAFGSSFPSQGTEVESTGTAGTSTRKVKVVRFHPAPPAIFDFAIYSGGSLEHQ